MKAFSRLDVTFNLAWVQAELLVHHQARWDLLTAQYPALKEAEDRQFDYIVNWSNEQRKKWRFRRPKSVEALGEARIGILMLAAFFGEPNICQLATPPEVHRLFWLGELFFDRHMEWAKPARSRARQIDRALERQDPDWLCYSCLHKDVRRHLVTQVALLASFVEHAAYIELDAAPKGDYTRFVQRALDAFKIDSGVSAAVLDVARNSHSVRRRHLIGR